MTQDKDKEYRGFLLACNSIINCKDVQNFFHDLLVDPEFINRFMIECAEKSNDNAKRFWEKEISERLTDFHYELIDGSRPQKRLKK